MNYLEEYYNKYDEEGRLLSRHGQVEYLTTMRYIEECLERISDRSFPSYVRYAPKRVINSHLSAIPEVCRKTKYLRKKQLKEVNAKIRYRLIGMNRSINEKRPPMDKKENKKMLSEAEQRRLERFEKISENLVQQGYIRRDLTIGMGKANIVAVLLLIPLSVIGYGLYYLVNHKLEFLKFNPLIFFVVFLLFIVIHEFIHGLCWSFFTPHHFKDIEFGIMKPSMSPYCTCLVPLQKKHYLFGTVMPFIVLGIIPMIAGIAFSNSAALLLGIIMAASAAGDILIIQKIMGYKSNAKEIVYMDHPTEAGSVIFER